MKFRCGSCGDEHDLSKISFGTDAPLQWSLLSDAERTQSELTPEQCVIETQEEGLSFYIRACLEIPVRGGDSHFTWGVWCSLSENSFLEMGDHWENPKRQEFGPYFGWLCTIIPEYPDTAFLKTKVHQRPIGERPFVELEATDHPLSIHQQTGIDPTELQRIITNVLHEKTELENNEGH
jgi:hypothetical protein